MRRLRDQSRGLSLARLFRPRRFRGRLFAAMLVVALVPLASFAALVVADLGSMSQSTVAETQRTILADEHDRQVQQVADRARLVDERLAAIAAEVRQVRDQANLRLTAIAPGTAIPQTFSLYRGLAYATSANYSSSLLVGSSTRSDAPVAGQRGAALAIAGGQLLPLLQGMLKGYPEVQAIWLADNLNGAVYTVPGFDVADAVKSNRLDPAAPLGVNAATIFSTSQKNFAAPLPEGDSWANPDQPSRRNPVGPYWTDPYLTRQAGAEAVTVWMPSGDGHTLVGADVSIAPIAVALVDNKDTGAPGAYPILLSSTNHLLAAGASVQSDFGIAAGKIGGDLATPANDKSYGTTFTAGLRSVEQTGIPRILDTTTLEGIHKQLFTAPVYTAHWVLASAVPVADFEPDVSALTHGIDNGIHRLLLQAIPVALLLCLLAFVLARWFARRLVGPVKVLTVAAERLADGYTDESVPPQGSDEVGVLAASLERMRREINSARDAILGAARELEIRVTDRTAELRARNDDLVALNALAGSLTRSLDAGEIFRDALAAVRAVLPVRIACGFEVGVSGELRPVEGDEGAQADPQISTIDIELLGRIAHAAIDESGMARHDGSEILLGLALRSSDGPIGALALAAGDASEVERALPLLRAVADQVGLALRTARLSAEGRAHAVLEERTRLAREIHDTLAQQLTGIVIQLEAAEGLVPATVDTSATRHAVALARDLARQALQEARRSVWDLRPAPLAATGLVAALKSEVQRFEMRSGIEVKLSTDDLPHPLELQPQVEVAVLRIAQEALTNISKHSGGDSATLCLRVEHGNLKLEISDQGCGFDAEHGLRRADAFGILGMHERARLADAELTIVSDDDGTKITMTVPLTAAIGQLVASAGDARASLVTP